MYSGFFFSYYDSPLLVINVDNVDFVSNPEDYNELVSHIKRDVVEKSISTSRKLFLMKLIARSLDDTQLIAKEIASFIIQNQNF